jgi:hypothetical protein
LSGEGAAGQGDRQRLVDVAHDRGHGSEHVDLRRVVLRRPARAGRVELRVAHEDARRQLTESEWQQLLPRHDYDPAC